MTKGAIKAIASGLAVLLVGATVAAGVGSAKGGKPFQNPHIETWFNNWGKPSAATPSNPIAEPWGGVIDDVGNELNAETTYAMPAAMAFYSIAPMSLAEELEAPSVTVSCSHNFDFNNVKVDWSVEYPSGASAADVVTVTPTQDGSLSANVSCIAPAGFDTQLTLKATLRGNEEKTAACTIDYIKRIEDINNIVFNANDFGDDSGISCTPVFGAGTVNGNLRLKNILWDIDLDFIIGVKSYLNFPIEFTDHTEQNCILSDEYYAYTGDTVTYSMFIEHFDNYDEAHKNAIYYAWWTAYSELYNQNHNYRNIIAFASFELLYNGNVIQTYFHPDDFYGSITGDYYGSDLAPDLTLNTNVTL